MKGTQDSAVTWASSSSLSLLEAAEGEAVELVKVSKLPQGFSPKDNVRAFLSWGHSPFSLSDPPYPSSVFSISFPEAEEEAWGFCMRAGECLFLDQN